MIFCTDKKRLAITALAVVCTFFSPLLCAGDGDSRAVADVSYGSYVINWQPRVTYGKLLLAVSGPGDRTYEKTFSAGAAPYFELGQAVDGMYTYELRAVPEMGNRLFRGVDRALLGEHRGPRPKITVQVGYFRVEGGKIVTGGSLGEGPDKTMDEVIYDDLIVDGSLCVGNDCYSGYAFGFDTIVLMENNLRIYFDDTSNTSSFPNNDWRFIFNDTTDGGGAYFAVQDVSGGLTPFTIEAGAKTNSLYVDDDGQVGIGTSGPVFELHIREGDSPTVRLHQDTSYGWPEQIWDIGGNETSFFIRDGTHAARLPFRIEPETPSSTLCLKSDGKIGIGTWSPAYDLEVEDTGDKAEIVAQMTDGATTFMRGTGTQGTFGTLTNHRLRILSNDTWRLELATDDSLTMSSGAQCTSAGVWTDASSRELKENIDELSAEAAMKAFTGLKPVTFNYKKVKDDPVVGFIAEEVPELVAQKDRKTLSSMDIAAVLTKVLQEQQKLLETQQRTIDELKKEISKLKEKK